jgi:hypothetical protein
MERMRYSPNKSKITNKLCEKTILTLKIVLGDFFKAQKYQLIVN